MTEVRAHHSTNNPFEEKFGYSRAVRRGQFIYVSGTTAISLWDPYDIRYPGDSYKQASIAFNEGLRAVEALGGTIDDVVRVRMFVSKDGNSAVVGRAMRDVFGGCKFAATMICGAQFVDEDMLVEIELEAITDQRG